jgi:hypothetical protein
VPLIYNLCMCSIHPSSPPLSLSLCMFVYRCSLKFNVSDADGNNKTYPMEMNIGEFQEFAESIKQVNAALESS